MRLCEGVSVEVNSPQCVLGSFGSLNGVSGGFPEMYLKGRGLSIKGGNCGSRSVSGYII